MESVARIPLTAADERTVASLNGWMSFFAIMHLVAAAVFVVGAALGGVGGVLIGRVSAILAVLVVVQMVLWAVQGLLLAFEGILVFRARAALKAMLSSDTQDQTLVMQAFDRLRAFFMIEIVWFGLTILLATLSLAASFVVTPEQRGDIGERWVERVQEMQRGER